MRNELLGYLVGALESDEHSRVESELATDEQLRRDVEVLRRGLIPLQADGRLLDPPLGLATRTVSFVFTQAALEVTGPAGDAHVARSLPTWSEGPAYTRRWRFADVSVAAGILVAAFSIVVPALIQSRANAQRISCENRLTQTHTALTGFAEHHNGKLPGPEPRPGVERLAGIYGSQITQANYLKDHYALVCPGSDLDSQEIKIPTLAQLRAAKGPERERLIGIMGSTYAYAVGYWDEKGNYHPLMRQKCDSKYPLMADLAGKNGKPIGHHGGCGRNVLMADGAVKYLVTCRMQENNNDIYLNDDGEENAGTNANDTVLLRGDVEIRLIDGR
jgi:hypothetical protein